MARIAGIEPDRANLFTRVVYWFTKRKIGRIVEPLKIAAHQPRLLRAVGQMEMAQAGMKTVPAALKTLASVRVSTLVGCPF